LKKSFYLIFSRFKSLDDFPSVSKVAALAVLEMAKQTLTTEKMLHENFAG
jgi:hypothetical protein